MKLSAQDNYTITSDTIESIVYGMDKKGQIEHLARAKRDSSGSSFVYKGA